MTLLIPYQRTTEPCIDKMHVYLPSQSASLLPAALWGSMHMTGMSKGTRMWLRLRLGPRNSGLPFCQELLLADCALCLHCVLARTLAGNLSELLQQQLRGCASKVLAKAGKLPVLALSSASSTCRSSRPRDRSLSSIPSHAGDFSDLSAPQNQGNVYPTLSQDQIAAMTRRRLTFNCSTEQLISKHIAAHQAKHILLCCGTNCKTACNSCGSCGYQTGQRTWEYLSKRLGEINQLRAEQDIEQPILGSRIDCVQVSSAAGPLITLRMTSICRCPHLWLQM